ncbi:polysaccharide deacetylase family protein [bacterium]|nr:polysaccharide deacetylase family protein [bacterium]
MGIRSTIKKAVAAPLSAAGVPALARRAAGGGAAILCYHRVVDRPIEEFQPGMAVHVETFAEHMNFLTRHFDVIGLVEVCRRLTSNEPITRPTAVVTFDDGWLDNYTLAFPILKHYEIPATIFLPTGFVGKTDYFWNARVELAMPRIHARRDELLAAFPDEDMPPEAAFVMDALSEGLGPTQMIDRAILQTKVMPLDAIDRVTAFLEFLAQMDHPGERTVMSWDEVNEMAEAGVDFGGHSVTHRLMTELTAQEAYREAFDCMQTMTEHMGKRPLCFAYPNGNHDETVMREIRRAGYLCATTVVPGFAQVGAEMFALPRFGVHEGGAPNAAALDLLISGLL